MPYPAAIQNLINELTKLPTVGPKTAERFVFYLLKQNANDLQKLAQYIAELKEKTTICQNCLSYSESNPCRICGDAKRDKTQICLVANTQDMLLIESTHEYNGLYHILGGTINTINGIGPEQLNVKQLTEKITKINIKEIILALDPTLEGETTSLYIANLFKNTKILITRLAKGLPMGADLEYADEMTIINALKYRNKI